MPNAERLVGEGLLRQPRFWVVQGAGWTVVQLVLFWKDAVHSREAGATMGDTVLVFGVSISVCVAASSALAWAYLRLPAHWFRGWRLLPTVVGLSVPASATWTLSMWTLFRASDWFPRQELPDTLPLLATRGALLLIAWSSFFLPTLLAAQVEQARQTALMTEALAHRSRLQALRAQLNPHFLFNAMNSVVALIRLDPGRARQMLRDLADLLRRALDSAQRESSTLGEELDFLRQYLNCESVRLGDRLSVTLHVPESLLSEPMPSMLLQPLVENAVKHGVVTSDKLSIEIRAWTDAARLVVSVRNRGALGGLPREQGDEPGPAHFDSRSRGAPRGGGVGLRLVSERLSACYPTSGRFELAEASGYVVARVSYDPREWVDHPLDATVRAELIRGARP